MFLKQEKQAKLLRIVSVFTILLTLVVSCKKETVQPDPVPGQTIVKHSQGTYSGYIYSELRVRRWPGNTRDTSLKTGVCIYDKPMFGFGTSSSLNSASANTYPLVFDGYSYSLSLDSWNISTSYLPEYRAINYNINSPVHGNISVVDNRPLPSFSNHNTVPLNFSKSQGYTLTLNNLANCTGIEARLGLNMAYRSVPVLNPSFRFYESELLNTATGNTIELEITLHQAKDSVINGKKIYLDKEIIQSYQLTFIN